MKNESPGRSHPLAVKKAAPPESTTMLMRSDVDRTAPVRNVYSTTRFGKVLSIVRDGVTGWKIEMSGGGTFPPALEGRFTHIRTAQIAIDNYTEQD